MSYEHKNLEKINVDVGNESEMNKLFDYLERTYKHIDVFIANAGFAYYEYLQDKGFKDFDKIMHVNFYSVMLSAQKMKALNKDRPFNFMVTLSAVSYIQMPGYALYSASKTGLLGFLKSYRLELDKDQTIQCVFPVATNTNFFERAEQTRILGPVQSSEKVAKSMLKGLKRNKKMIYPFKPIRYGVLFAPWLLKLYVMKETKHFKKHHERG